MSVGFTGIFDFDTQVVSLAAGVDCGATAEPQLLSVSQHYDILAGHGETWTQPLTPWSLPTMTQPVISSLSSSSSQTLLTRDVAPLVQNNSHHQLKCAKCEKSFELEDLVEHLKEHTMGRGKSSIDVKDSKSFVKLAPMGIEIKRKRHGSKGENCKRIKLQDGETELSVDPTVEKVKCKSCKPTKYFQDVETLRYHLIASHGISANCSNYVNPSISPAKLESLQNLEISKKVRVKSPSELSEIKDFEEMEDKDSPKATSSCLGLEGSLREVLRRRTKLTKRPSIVNCSASTVQPPCTSERSEAPPSENAIGEMTQSGDGATRVEESTVAMESDLKSEPGTFVVPAPVKEGRRSGKIKATSKKPEPKIVEPHPKRRRSERRFEGVKPFKCNHCELSYSSLENKKVHEATHTDKIHLCMYCEMRFYFPLCLKRHYRIHKS